MKLCKHYRYGTITISDNEEVSQILLTWLDRFEVGKKSFHICNL